MSQYSRMSAGGQEVRMSELVHRAPANRIPTIDDVKCRACRRCLARPVCRPKAIVQVDPGEPPVIDASRCFGCLICASQCPVGAIGLPDPIA
jgi:MinD superfamily P-loop ATPase